MTQSAKVIRSHDPHLNQLSVTLAPLKSHTGKMRIPLLTVLTNDLTVIELVLPVMMS